MANAILACQRTFLDEQKWKDIPWEDDPSAKPHFDYLVDVLSDIPQFLEEIAHAHTPTTISWPKRSGNETLQKQLLERLQILRELREAWHIKYSTPLWEVPITSDSSQGPDSITPPFDAAFYFTNMFRAYEFCIYQINCLILFLLYRDLSPGNLQPVEDILPGLFPNGSVQNLARNICRCTEFLCSEQNGSRGYIVLQFPATVTYFAIDKNSPEAKWLYHICKKRARSSGFGWGDFAMDQISPLSQWMAACRDRHSSGHFVGGQPCCAPDMQEHAMETVTPSSPSAAAMPLRESRRPEEAVWHPP